MTISVVSELLQPWTVIAEYQQQSADSHNIGATASFIGTMRDFNDDAEVSEMFLEHYPDMTARYLDKLEQQARAQWPLLDCLIMHRVGHIYPGDAIVVIACWSAHRRAALDACNWLIEELKQRAPFWKKEKREQQAFWVEHNTDGF